MTRAWTRPLGQGLQHPKGKVPFQSHVQLHMTDYMFGVVSREDKLRNLQETECLSSRKESEVA